MRTSRAGTWSRRQAGFTFIELAIVLLLLGILLLVAVPRFGRITQGSLKAAARQMYGTVATAHDRAALQKRRFWLGMEIGKGDWWLVATEAGEALSPQDVIMRRALALMDGTLPGGVVFLDVSIGKDEQKEGTALAAFEPNGTCAVAMIHLADDGGHFATLTINPLTGRCVIDNDYVRPPEPAPEETAPKAGQPERQPDTGAPQAT